MAAIMYRGKFGNEKAAVEKAYGQLEAAREYEIKERSLRYA
jgi:hypothetical protein